MTEKKDPVFMHDTVPTSREKLLARDEAREAKLRFLNRAKGTPDPGGPMTAGPLEPVLIESSAELLETLVDYAMQGFMRVYVRSDPTSADDFEAAFRERLAQVAQTIVTEVAEFKEDRDRVERQLNDLLAIIHRDGGHYTGQHGITKAIADAHATWAEVVRERDEARAEVERLRAMLPPTAHTGVRNGPGEGSWAVFAEKVVAERDELQRRLDVWLAFEEQSGWALKEYLAAGHDPLREIARLTAERDEARAQLAALRGADREWDAASYAYNSTHAAGSQSARDAFGRFHDACARRSAVLGGADAAAEAYTRRVRAEALREAADARGEIAARSEREAAGPGSPYSLDLRLDAERDARREREYESWLRACAEELKAGE